MTLHINAFILISLLNLEIAVVPIFFFNLIHYTIYILKKILINIIAFVGQITKYNKNKDENVHRFALSAKREELLESEREKESEVKQAN